VLLLELFTQFFVFADLGRSTETIKLEVAINELLRLPVTFTTRRVRTTRRPLCSFQRTGTAPGAGRSHGARMRRFVERLCSLKAKQRRSMLLDRSILLQMEGTRIGRGAHPNLEGPDGHRDAISFVFDLG
jgi:hypothetical protein